VNRKGCWSERWLPNFTARSRNFLKELRKTTKLRIPVLMTRIWTPDRLFYVQFFLNCLFLFWRQWPPNTKVGSINIQHKHENHVLFHKASDKTCVASRLYHREAPPRLSRLIARFSLRRSGWIPVGVHAGFVNKVALGGGGRLLFEHYSVRLSFITPPMLHTHLSSGVVTMSPSVSALRLD
jgi:hypothetical protein